MLCANPIAGYDPPMTSNRQKKHAAGMLLTAVVLASFSGPAWGQSSLRSFESRFYTVRTNLQRHEVKPVAHRMDVIFHHFRKRFENFERHVQSEITVYLFRTRKQYVQFMQQHGVDARNSGGMFFVLPDHGLHGLATWVQNRSQKRLISVLQHEGFHQFAFHHIGRNLPQWVNEGLAQYFEDARIEGERMEMGRINQKRARRLEMAFRQENLMPLGKILSLSMRDWQRIVQESRDASARMYAQAWSMVYFLVHGEGGKYREPFKQYLHLLAKGHTNRQAAEEAFKVESFKPMQRKWLRFIRHRLFD
jgi:hypothetical protein